MDYEEKLEREKQRKIDDEMLGNDYQERTAEEVMGFSKNDFFSWPELKKKEFPETKWRIEKLVPYEGFTLLASVSGESKSWLAHEMVRCVAQGIPYLGKFETLKGNSLIIDGEMGKGEIQRRGKQLGLEESEGGKIYFLSKDSYNLNDDDEVQSLLFLIAKLNISMVVVDTFRSVANGLKEDKAEDIRVFYNRFKSLKDQGVSCIFLDHLRKAGPFEGKHPKKEQVLASQDKVASCDSLLMIQKDKNTGKINFYQMKNRQGFELEPFVIKMKDQAREDGSIVTTLTYDGPMEEDSIKKERAKEEIPNILSEGGKTQKEIVEMCLKLFDIGSRNSRDALKELEMTKVVIKRKDGHKNFYELNATDTSKEDDFGDF